MKERILDHTTIAGLIAATLATALLIVNISMGASTLALVLNVLLIFASLFGHRLKW